VHEGAGGETRVKAADSITNDTRRAADPTRTESATDWDVSAPRRRRWLVATLERIIMLLGSAHDEYTALASTSRPTEAASGRRRGTDPGKEVEL
jgi:hypothetical protein